MKYKIFTYTILMSALSAAGTYQAIAADDPSVFNTGELSDSWGGVTEDIETDLFPKTLTLQDCRNLAAGQQIEKVENGITVYLKASDPKALNSLLPGTWQIISSPSFSSSKTREIVLADQTTYHMDYTLPRWGQALTGKNKVTLTGSLFAQPALNINIKEDQVEDQSILISETEGETSYDSETFKMRAVGNFLQKPFKSYAITPGTLSSDLEATLAKDFAAIQWTNSATLYGKHTKLPLFKSTLLNGKRIVISDCGHDMIETPEYKGTNGLPLNIPLYAISKDVSLAGQDMVAYIPISQTRGNRQHFTLLKAERNNGNWAFTHIDSLGFRSWAYSLTPIIEVVKPYGGKLTAQYLGQQGTFNNTDCGRYVQSYILHDMQGHDIRNLSQDKLKQYFK